MDHSVSSSRMLINIERSEWIDFIKDLCKEDRQRFEKLFSITKLYHYASSNLSNQTTVEPFILSLVFNNFKIIHDILTMTTTTTTTTTIKSINDENNSIKDGDFQICESRNESEIEIQIGFNKIIQDWHRFIECLNEDDEFIFMKMISDCYDIYHKSINSSTRENSDS